VSTALLERVRGLAYYMCSTYSFVSRLNAQTFPLSTAGAVQKSVLTSSVYVAPSLLHHATLSIKEMVTFFSKTIVKRTPAGQRQTVQHEGESFGFCCPSNTWPFLRRL
jgi:hypothetical protein